jgi:hypothetical protein
MAAFSAEKNVAGFTVSITNIFSINGFFDLNSL